MANAVCAVILFLVLFGALCVQSTFIPRTGLQSTMKVKPACPSMCQCTATNTSNCVFQYDAYSVSVLKQWRITRLRIYGNDEGDQSVINDGSSLRSVFGKGSESLSVEEMAFIFNGMVELHVNFVKFQQVFYSDLENLADLTVLDIAHNGISTIQSGSLRGLKKLKVLNLEGNHISSLPPDAFEELKDLKNLSLNGNQLQMLARRSFIGLDMLEHLNLQDNELLQIDNFINGLNTLKVFDVGSNRLTYVLSDSVEKLSTFGEVRLANNTFQCSCVVSSLITAVKARPSVYKSDIFCDSPPSLKGQRLIDVDAGSLECDKAEVLAVSAPSYGLYQREVTLSCSVSGTPPLGVYWITPWGDRFANDATQRMFTNETLDTKNYENYNGINLILNSHVEVAKNGTLHIDKFRGILAGEFTCVSFSFVGQGSNKSVNIAPLTKMRSIYLTSTIIGSICAFSALFLAIFVGAVQWFVRKCMHAAGCNCCCCNCDEDDVDSKKCSIEDTETVEVTYAATDVCHELDDDFDPDSSPPTVPVNSPQLRSSPNKCHTSVADLSELDNEKNSSHIFDQLDEVRTRLRDGAGKKIEKVRSHVRSITDSGSLKIRNIKDASSLKIQSIKETGSHAASKVRKNVVVGMETVKYGVQSIKEFCGTGDMGTGTISMVSVCTDVDTKEQFKIVKSHTFV